MAKASEVTLKVISEFVDKGFKKAEQIIRKQSKLEKQLYKDKKKFIKDNIKDETRRNKELDILRQRRKIKIKQFNKRRIELARQFFSSELQRIKRFEAKKEKIQKEQLNKEKIQKTASKNLTKRTLATKQRLEDIEIKRKIRKANHLLKIQKRIFKRTLKAEKESHRRAIADIKETVREEINQRKKAAKKAKQAIRDQEKREKEREKRKRERARETARQQIEQAKKVRRSISNLASLGTMASSVFMDLFHRFTELTKDMIQTGAAFEQSITNVSAVANLSVSETKKLEVKARELGASTAYTATQVAEGMTDLARAGLKADKIIGAIGPTLYLAGAAGSDLSSATKLMARTMAQFNLEAEDAGKVADTFTLAMQNSLLNMQSLNSSMRYAGAGAGAFGWDIGETTAAVALFMDQTGMGSTAGTQFRHVLLSLAGPTREAKKVIAGLAKSQGVSYKIMRDRLNPATSDFKTILENLKPIMKDHDKLLKLVNKRSSGSLQKILKDYHNERSKFESLVNLFKTQAGAAEATYAKQMNTVVGKTKIVQSKIQESFLQLFDAFGLPIKKILDFLGEAFDEVILNFEAMSAVLKLEVLDAFNELTGGIGESSNTAQTFGQIVSSFIIRLIQWVIWIKGWIITFIPIIKRLFRVVVFLFTYILTSKLIMFLGKVTYAIYGIVVALKTAKMASMGFLVLTAKFAIIAGLIAGIISQFTDLGDMGVSSFSRVNDTINIQTELLRQTNKEFDNFLKTVGGKQGSVAYQKNLRQGADKLLTHVRSKTQPYGKNTKEVEEAILETFFLSTKEIERQKKSRELLPVGSKIIPQAVQAEIKGIDPNLELVPLKAAFEIAKAMGKQEEKNFKTNVKNYLVQLQLQEAYNDHAQYYLDNIDQINNLKVGSNQVKDSMGNTVTVAQKVSSNLALQARLQEEKLEVVKALTGDLTSQVNVYDMIENGILNSAKEQKALDDVIKLTTSDFLTVTEGVKKLQTALTNAGASSSEIEDVVGRYKFYFDLANMSADQMAAKFHHIDVTTYNAGQQIKSVYGTSFQNLLKGTGFGAKTMTFTQGLMHLDETFTNLKLNFNAGLPNFHFPQQSMDALEKYSDRLKDVQLNLRSLNYQQKATRVADPIVKELKNTALKFSKEATQNMSEIGIAFSNLLSNNAKKTAKNIAKTTTSATNSALNALKAFYKKLLKLEEDAQKRLEKIRAKDTDKYILNLNQKLRSLRKFFNEGMKLFKKNSKAEIAVLKRQAALMNKERTIAREAALKERKKETDKIEEQLKSATQNELEKLKEKHKKEIEAFQNKETAIQQIIVSTIGTKRGDIDSLFTRLNTRIDLDVTGWNKQDYIKKLDEAIRLEKKAQEDLIIARKLKNQESIDIEIENLKKAQQAKMLLVKQFEDWKQDFERNIKKGIKGPKMKFKGQTNVLSSIKELLQIVKDIDTNYASVAFFAGEEVEEFLENSVAYQKKIQERHAIEMADFMDKNFYQKLEELEKEFADLQGQSLSDIQQEKLQALREELKANGLSIQQITEAEKRFANVRLAILRNYAKEINSVSADSSEREIALITKSLLLRKQAAEDNIKGKKEEDTQKLKSEADYLAAKQEMEERQQKEIAELTSFYGGKSKKQLEEELKTSKGLGKFLPKFKKSKAEIAALEKIIAELSLTELRHLVEELELEEELKKMKESRFESLKKFLSTAYAGFMKFLDILKSIVSKIKQGIDFMTGGRLELNPFTLMTKAADELLKKQDEFIEKQRDLQKEFRAGRITKTEYEAGMSVARAERGNAAQIAKELVDNMIEESLRFMDALVKVAPIIIQRLIDRLPEITAALERMIPQLVRIIDQLYPAFVPVLTKMFTLAAQVFAKVVMQILFKDRTSVGSKGGAGMGSVAGGLIGGMAGGPLGYLLGAGLGGLIGGVFGDTPNPIKVRSQAGMLARFAHGDTVIAAKEPQELLRQALQAVGSEVKMATRRPPAPPTRNTGNSSGGAKIDIAVIAEGRVLDAVQMQALERGHAPKIAKRLRKASGVKVGFNRGRYNKFAVNEN